MGEQNGERIAKANQPRRLRENEEDATPKPSLQQIPRPCDDAIHQSFSHTQARRERPRGHRADVRSFCARPRRHSRPFSWIARTQTGRLRFPIGRGRPHPLRRSVRLGHIAHPEPELTAGRHRHGGICRRGGAARAADEQHLPGLFQSAATNREIVAAGRAT